MLAIIKTCRIAIRGQERIAPLKAQNRPIIYIFWHRHIFFTIYRFRNTGASPLISLSRDGEIVSQIAEEFGMRPIRGSSSRGGMRAFLTLLNTIKDQNGEILITADGPKGPAGELKDGTVVLAQKSKAVIVPISWYASKVKILEKTWDRFIVPRPFGKIVFAYGAPSQVAHEHSKDSLEAEKLNLKKMLDELGQETERYFR
jgi:lysophospholipid acyltransferase (LPLAT)-like uncharacterized protein